MTMPINRNGAAVGTVAYWRSAAPHYGCRSWREAMRRFCAQHGKAIAMLADDGALFMERNAEARNGVKEWHFAPEEIRWV